jgi:hypothetical protein
MVTADHANTKADFIVSIHVSALPVIRATCFDNSITIDDTVVTDPVPSESQMHVMYLTRAQQFIIRRSRTVDNEVLDIAGLQHVGIITVYREPDNLASCRFVKMEN